MPHAEWREPRARAAAAPGATRLARLYAAPRSGGPSATPHPPGGAARGRPIRDRALAPPGAKEGDTARHRVRPGLPRPWPSREIHLPDRVAQSSILWGGLGEERRSLPPRLN